MALILDPTPGASTANTYASLIDAAAYMEGFLDSSAWDDLDDDVKNRALVTATRLLDESVTWIGTRVNASQALEWPRSGAMTRGGYAIPSSIIPLAVIKATVEFARLLAAAGTVPNSPSDVPAGLQSVSAGSVSVTFDPQLVGGIEDVLPASVIAIISYLIEPMGISGRTNVPLIRA